MPDAPQGSSSPSDGEDLELVRAALADSRRAQRELLHRMQCIPRFLLARNAQYGRPLHEHELEDLAQDVWLSLWTKLDRFRGPSLEAWAYRFCALDFLKRLRDLGRRAHLGTAELAARTSGKAAPVQDPFAFEELHRGLASLPEDEATPIEWKHFEGLGFEAIGERLGIPANTAKSRYHRGLARLRRLLGDERRLEERRRQA